MKGRPQFLVPTTPKSWEAPSLPATVALNPRALSQNCDVEEPRMGGELPRPERPGSGVWTQVLGTVRARAVDIHTSRAWSPSTLVSGPQCGWSVSHMLGVLGPACAAPSPVPGSSQHLRELGWMCSHRHPPAAGCRVPGAGCAAPWAILIQLDLLGRHPGRGPVGKQPRRPPGPRPQPGRLVPTGAGSSRDVGSVLG